MAEFNFYIDPGDQAKMERIFNDLAAFDTNKDVKKAYQKAGNYIRNQGTASWLGMSRLTVYRLNNQGKLTGLKTQGYTTVGKTLEARFSQKKDSLREYVGHTTKVYHKIGKLAHIFDRGTAKRYTKKGYYRGYIFKSKGVKQGTNAWTRTVEKCGPEVTKDIIIPAINRILTTITLK